MSKVKLGAWTYAAVGVAELDVALSMWCGDFGFEILAEASGADPELARLWSIDADNISRQVILATPGISRGQLHLVEFRQPDVAVRDGARSMDSTPKNLDIHVRDLPAQFERLKKAGYHFHSDNYSEMKTEDGIHFREVQMLGHDYTNIVLVEIMGETHPFTTQGVAGIGPAVTTVNDMKSETAFYQTIFGLDSIHEVLLDGPEIEKMIGLPEGAGLDVRVLGDEHEHMGRVELVEYQQVQGEDRYPLARAPSRGFLHLCFVTEQFEDFKALLKSKSIDFTDYGLMHTLYGERKAMSLFSPAGFRVEVHSG